MSQESQSGERRAQPVAAWAGAGSAGGCTARTEVRGEWRDH